MQWTSLMENNISIILKIKELQKNMEYTVGIGIGSNSDVKFDCLLQSHQRMNMSYKNKENWDYITQITGILLVQAI